MDIGAGRIKSEASMSHKHDSMVRSVVETMMVYAKNTNLRGPALAQRQQLY